jgi:hypothetical protein
MVNAYFSDDKTRILTYDTSNLALSALTDRANQALLWHSSCLSNDKPKRS